MSFGNNFPDEDKIIESINRVRAAFDSAAATPGSAQPLFERLAKKFSRAIDDVLELRASGTDPQKAIMKMMPTLMDLQLTLSMIKKKSETDPSIAQTMQTLQETLQDEVKGLVGGLDLGGLAGGGFPGFPPIGRPDDTQRPQPPRQERPQPPKEPQQKPPKKGDDKPKSGDFKL